jgi:hypothetical protein
VSADALVDTDEGNYHVGERWNYETRRATKARCSRS